MAITLVSASDWNPVIQKMRSVLSTPSGSIRTLGYNATYSANDVSSGGVITGLQWNNLRSDVNKAYTLQTGSASDLTTRDNTYLITQADLTTISARVDTAYNNRLNVNTGQLNVTAKSQSGTNSWGTYSYCSFMILFNDNATFRGFWNASGRIVVYGSRSGGSSTSQNQGWTNLLSNMGNIVIARDSIFQSGQSWNGTLPITNGVYGGSIGTGYTTIFTGYDQDTNYTANYCQVQVSMNNTNPDAATSMNVLIYCRDNHTAVAAGPDYVDGTISLSADLWIPNVLSTSVSIVNLDPFTQG